MAYSVQPLSCDPAVLDGLSAKLIASHHANNYAGAVRRLNAIRGEFAKLDLSAAPGFAVGALKREELIAANSAFLHELYFDCLGAPGELKIGGLSVAFARDFGSFAKWRAEFTAIGRSLGGGSGWALCSWSERESRLVNHWSADHTHLLAGATPILALDMYEHAYHMDFGADAAAYVETFMRNIDWTRANVRYAHALEQSTGELSVGSDVILRDRDAYEVIDVRRAGAYQAAPDQIAGASWKDPETVAQWAAELPAGKSVVVYCVYGHEVGQSTSAYQRDKGISAKFLTGGIQDWKAAGLPMQKK